MYKYIMLKQELLQNEQMQNSDKWYEISKPTN